MPRRSVKGVHYLLADAIVSGERWCTCACGQQWHGTKRSEVWAAYWRHTQGRR